MRERLRQALSRTFTRSFTLRAPHTIRECVTLLNLALPRPKERLPADMRDLDRGVAGRVDADSIRLWNLRPHARATVLRAKFTATDPAGSTITGQAAIAPRLFVFCFIYAIASVIVVYLLIDVSDTAFLFAPALAFTIFVLFLFIESLRSIRRSLRVEMPLLLAFLRDAVEAPETKKT